MQTNEDILEIVQNYIRLQNLLNNIALPLLRKTFINNWKIKCCNEWTNSEVSGTEFISNIGSNVFKSAGNIQKKMLKSGDIDKWDLPLVINALKPFHESSKSDAIFSDEQYRSLNTLKRVRNELFHHGGGLEIENEVFEQWWKLTAEALINCGVSKEVIDKAKIVSVQENQINVENAMKLKDEGNIYFKNQNFSLAVSKYSEAIYQPGLPTKELAILYSNRSLAHLKQENYYAAKDDGILATLLNPNWWKGFGRLGHAYLGLEKYKRALENFEEAVRLDPSCKVQNERAHCVHMIAKLSRYEHLDPMNHSTTFHQFVSDLKDKETYDKLKDYLHVHKPRGMCFEGHKYLLGQGVTQSYERAAQWFAMAAAEGNAEGYYNLALLTGEGKGVQLNVAESIRLMELAASQDLSMDIAGFKVSNIGVIEAQHSLGMAYLDGVGLEKADYQRALNWFHRAIKHGSGISANSVGYMYDRGIGVPMNALRALDYFKLSSTMKVVRAMENAAKVYLRLSDKVNARKWFLYAMSRGSLDLQTKKQDYLDLIGDELKTPIEIDIFELQLKEEVKAGPLADLIVEGLPLSPSEFKEMMT